MVGHLRGGHHAGHAPGQGHLDVAGGFIDPLHSRRLDNRAGLRGADVALLPWRAVGVVTVGDDTTRSERELDLLFTSVGANHGCSDHLADGKSLLRGLIRGESQVLETRQAAKVPVELHEDTVGLNSRDDTVCRRTRRRVIERGDDG